MKKRNILSCLAVLALVALGIARLNVLFRPVDTDSPVTAIETFHTLPENAVEVMGFGSSHMWLGLDEASDFSGTGHLNASGAAKIARYMGAYLKANYSLTDFRTRQDNLWEQAKER